MHGFLAELANFVARSFRFQEGVIDQASKTGFYFNYRRAARDSVGTGIDYRAGFSSAFLGAVQVAIRANFVVAADAASYRPLGRSEVAQHFFGDDTDHLFEFALIH